MINWRNKTDNPDDQSIKNEMLEFFKNIRKIDCNHTHIEYIIENVENKRVLDIGIAEHDAQHIDSGQWKHRQINRAASYCVGIDILQNLVDYINNLEEGYNAICMDATSNEYIGEKFDVVVLGDVIEHVDNPVSLLQFVKRHLVDDGKVFVLTPNPFCYNYFFQTLKKSTFIANFEHVNWITPSMMHELCLRTGFTMLEYRFFAKTSGLKKLLVKKLPIEVVAPSFFYVLTPKYE